MPFAFEKMQIKEVILIKPDVFEDARGFFLETYKNEDFNKFGIKSTFVQDSMSFSKKGVLRGLHFQKEPFQQAKLVSVIKGRIFDVVVDIRRASKTYGKHVFVELSDRNRNMIYIPRGFAHGFLCLEDSLVEYKIDNTYSKIHEFGIAWNDPELGIKWPVSNPMVSEKDSKWPGISSIQDA